MDRLLFNGTELSKKRAYVIPLVYIFLYFQFPNAQRTGFPRYSRWLRSWEILILNTKTQILGLNNAKLVFFPLLFLVFPVFWFANNRNREYQDCK